MLLANQARCITQGRQVSAPASSLAPGNFRLLVTARFFIIPEESETKGVMRGAAGRFKSHLWNATAAILLLFPNSASVLCIAPGGHVAIEDINSSCCASSHAVRPAPQKESGVSTAVLCSDCTDLFLTPNGRGAIPESYFGIVPGFPAGEYLGNHGSVDIAFSIIRQGIVGRIAASKTSWSPVPLRC